MIYVGLLISLLGIALIFLVWLLGFGLLRAPLAPNPHKPEHSRAESLRGSVAGRSR